MIDYIIKICDGVYLFFAYVYSLFCNAVYTTFLRWSIYLILPWIIYHFSLPWSIYLILAMKYIPKFGNGLCITIFRWSMYHIVMMKYVHNLPDGLYTIFACIYYFCNWVYTIFAWCIYHIFFVMNYILYFSRRVWTTFGNGDYAIWYIPHFLQQGIYWIHRGICCPKTSSILVYALFNFWWRGSD
jgi:hypothetical protein